MNGLMLSGSRNVHAAHEAMCTRHPVECDQLAYDAAAALFIGTGATCLGLVYAGSAATAAMYIADSAVALASDAMGAVTTAMAAMSAGVATAASAAAALPDDSVAGLADLLVGIWWNWKLWSWWNWEPWSFQWTFKPLTGHSLKARRSSKPGASTVALTTELTSLETLGNNFDRLLTTWKRILALILLFQVTTLFFCLFLLLPPAALVRQWAGQGYLGHLGHLTGLWSREFVLERDCA